MPHKYLGCLYFDSKIATYLNGDYLSGHEVPLFHLIVDIYVKKLSSSAAIAFIEYKKQQGLSDKRVYIDTQKHSIINV